MIILQTSDTAFETKREIEALFAPIGFDSCLSRENGNLVIDNDICSTAKVLGRYADMLERLNDAGIEYSIH